MIKKLAKLTLLGLVAVTVVLIIGFTLFAGYSWTPSATPNINTNEAQPTQYIGVTVQGIPLMLDASLPGYCYETTLMTTEFAMEFAMGEYSGWDITIDGVPVKSGITTKVKVDKLDKDIAVIIKMMNRSTGEQIEQYIRTLPNTIRNYTALSRVNNGVYYYAHDGFALKMNHKGEIIFYYADAKASHKYLNEFKKTEINGETFYIITAQLMSTQYPALKSGAGPNAKGIVLDKNYYIIDEVNWLYETERTPANVPLDQHEIKMLGKGHYLFTGYLGERVNNFNENVEHSQYGARVVASIFQEVKDGKVVFEWYSTDFPELYEHSSFDNDYFNATQDWSDYAHINSVDIDPEDGNYFCSFRNLDAMLKIDSQTGDIIWVLSGIGDQFGLTKAQKTSKQHDIGKVGENTYSVYDNGNDNQQTRVVEYTIDEKNKRLIDFKEYYLEKIFSPAQGNAQKIDDSGARYIMSGGMWNTSGNSLFYDIDFETKEVLFEAIPVRSDGPYEMVYRAYRFES